MAKNEVYLYERLNSYSAKEIVSQLNEFGEEPFTLRMDCPGGNVSSGWAILSKISEMTQEKTLIIDGEAMSMGAYMTLFFEKVVANDTSEFMFHKAAYPSYHDPSAEEEEALKKINDIFKKKMEATSVPKDVIAKIFTSDVRHDIHISAADAKKYGIVTELRNLDVAEKTRMKAVAFADTCSRRGISLDKVKTAEVTANINNKNNNLNSKDIMDLNKLRVEHPSVYAEAVAAGADQEKKRANSFLAHVKVAKDSCAERSIKAIKDGEIYIDAMAEITVLAISEIQKVAMTSENIEDLGLGNATPGADRAEAVATTPEAKLALANKKIEDDQYASVMANFGKAKPE